MKKIIRKNLGIKLLGAVNCLALCLTAYTANLACNWLYYQEDELTNYRINKAKELLLINSRRKVQDIASDVGYSDASHFIVMFKKLTGMTPAQFRKLHI